MARSALFDRFRRTLWLADEMRATGMSASEIFERRQELAFSRRRALLALGGAGAAAALGSAGCAAPTEDLEDADPVSGVQTAGSALKSDRIVVVGAGLAGLTAAYRLSQRRFNPRVFDAGKRVGGRVLTLRQGFPSKVEMGGEVIDTGHKELRKLAVELGLTVLDQNAATTGLQDETYWLGGAAYTEAQALSDFAPVSAILRNDWQSQGRAYATYDSPPPAAVALDRLSIADWLDRHGISGNMRKLLDVAYTAEYGLEIDQQSYLNLLYLIGRKAPPLELFGASDERFTIQEGNDAMATRMAAALPASVTLEHTLVAVRPRADGTLAVVFDNRGRTVQVIADKLVLALPFNQLRKCNLSGLSFIPQKATSIANVVYGTNAKLMIATRSRPWETRGAAGTSFTDAVYHEAWSSSRGFPGPGAVMTSYTGGALGVAIGDGNVNAHAAAFVAQLEKVYPGTAASYTGKAVRMHWPTTPLFEGSYACYRPGDWTSFVGSERVVEGNIHFAGEHTSLDYQGFMNGAVESGERVAKEIRKALRDVA